MSITTTADDLWAAVETFDAEAAEVAIARLLWDVPLSGAVTGVVLPFLQEVGDRWEAGTISVAHEHFVSDMLRRTLTALAAVPPAPVLADATAVAPVVLLACPPRRVRRCSPRTRRRGASSRPTTRCTPPGAARTSRRSPRSGRCRCRPTPSGRSWRSWVR